MVGLLDLDEKLLGSMIPNCLDNRSVVNLKDSCPCLCDILSDDRWEVDHWIFHVDFVNCLVHQQRRLAQVQQAAKAAARAAAGRQLVSRPTS
jgi:hypothetical protein